MSADPRLVRRLFVLRLAALGGAGAALPAAEALAQRELAQGAKDPAPPGVGPGPKFPPETRPPNRQPGLTDDDPFDEPGRGRGRRAPQGVTDNDPNDPPGRGIRGGQQGPTDNDPNDPPGRGRGGPGSSDNDPNDPPGRGRGGRPGQPPGPSDNDPTDPPGRSRNRTTET